jgi:hypothetical protein
MTDNLAASQDIASATRGFRYSVILRQQRRVARDGAGGKHSEAANATKPLKKPAVTRIRHRVSGTNRRARSA